MCSIGSSISWGRGGVGQVRGTFFKVLRVCRNPVYHERPDRASHSRNARVWRFTHGFRAPRYSFTAWHVSESKASATILNLLLSEILCRRCDPSSVSSLLVYECFLECERGFQNQLFLRSASESRKQSSLMAMKSAKLNVRYERPLKRAVSISLKE